MDLCLSLLKDELSYASELYFPQEELPSFSEPLFSYFVIYHESQMLDKKSLVISHAEDLPEEVSYKRNIALLCLGKPPQKYINAQIPILALLEEVDLKLLINDINEVFYRYNTLESKLNNAVDEGSNIQELVDIMHPFVGNELNVSDSNHRMVAHSFSTFRNITLSGFVVDKDRDTLPAEVIGFFVNNKRWVEVRTATEPFIYDEGIFIHRLLCQNITSEKEFVYRISFGETEFAFRPYDPYLIVFFSKFIRKVYERVSGSKQARRADTLADALRMLLLDEEVESWRVYHGLTVMKHDANSKYLCLCLRPKFWDESMQTNAYYCEQLRKLFRGFVAFEYEDDIICLANLAYYEYSVDSLLKTMTPFIRDNNFRLGVSELFTDVLCFKNYYSQAEIALTFGLEETPSQWVHRFRDQAVNVIIKNATKDIGIPTLCAEEILTLHHYDQEHHSNYIETIECYFRHNFNATETAARLKVHRTTFLYRLKKVEEISGIDFADSEKNLHYQLSIRLLDLID